MLKALDEKLVIVDASKAGEVFDAFVGQPGMADEVAAFPARRGSKQAAGRTSAAWKACLASWEWTERVLFLMQSWSFCAALLGTGRETGFMLLPHAADVPQPEPVFLSQARRECVADLARRANIEVGHSSANAVSFSGPRGTGKTMMLQMLLAASTVAKWVDGESLYGVMVLGPPGTEARATTDSLRTVPADDSHGGGSHLHEAVWTPGAGLVRGVQRLGLMEDYTSHEKLVELGKPFIGSDHPMLAKHLAIKALDAVRSKAVVVVDEMQDYYMKGLVRGEVFAADVLRFATRSITATLILTGSSSMVTGLIRRRSFDKRFLARAQPEAIRECSQMESLNDTKVQRRHPLVAISPHETGEFLRLRYPGESFDDETARVLGFFMRGLPRLLTKEAYTKAESDIDAFVASQLRGLRQVMATEVARTSADEHRDFKALLSGAGLHILQSAGQSGARASRQAKLWEFVMSMKHIQIEVRTLLNLAADARAQASSSSSSSSGMASTLSTAPWTEDEYSRWGANLATWTDCGLISAEEGSFTLNFDQPLWWYGAVLYGATAELTTAEVNAMCDAASHTCA